MSEKKNVPKLRFPGFTGPWEQRKLGALCDVFTDGDWIEAKDQSDSGIRLVQTGNVGTTEYLDKENNKKWISEETFERLHCEEIYEGDILISRLPEPAGRACIMPDLGVRMITAVDCTIVRTSKEYDSKYLVQYLSTPIYFKIVNSFLGGGTRQRISRGNLSGIDIPIPSTIDEQRKIGEFFANLDNLITLHQRKLDHIKDLKKSMLQKMFPKNGEVYPELRFPGFTEAWEQRKLGNVFKEYSEKNHTELPALTIIQGSGTVKREDSERNLMYDESNLSNYKMVRKDDFIVHLRSFEGGLEKSSLDGIISPAYHTFHSDIADSRFYYPYFRSHEFIRHKLVPHVYGIRDGRSIDIDGMKTIEIPYTLMEEQRKIGDCLESLDHLITLHQRELDHLQLLKKGMLQQMFV